MDNSTAEAGTTPAVQVDEVAKLRAELVKALTRAANALKGQYGMGGAAAALAAVAQDLSK